MHDVFFSFSFQDQAAAEDIVNRLANQYGIRCWICTRDVKGGEHYKSRIVDAIEKSKVVVLVQSASAVNSKEIPKEISLALDGDKIIIPFRLDESEPKGDMKYDLSGIDWIDATKPEYEERIFDLARSIKKELGEDVSIVQAEESETMASTPISCSEIFYGRDELIQSIHAAYGERNTVFLRGMGGIGKSEIAKQYARRYRDEYSTVVFAHYESSLVALLADDSLFAVQGTSRKTKANDTMQTDEEYAEDKLRIIRRRCDRRTLIIIDNYDVTSDPLMERLADGAPYRVLVTTRCEPERGKYHALQVREMGDEQLKDMIIDYANPEITMISRDDPAFPELFDLTNRHTLTLELIAKYMDEKCIDDVGEMVALLKEKNLAVLSDSDMKNGFEAIRGMLRLTRLNEKERAFLRCLALLPSEGVNQRLFRQWAGDVFTARSRLAGLSLVRIDSAGILSLHPVVREVVISELKPCYESCRAFIDQCVMRNQDAVPLMWSMDYEKKRAHLECYMSIIRYMGEINEDNAPVFRNISVMCNYIGSFNDAIALQRRRYDFACRRYGEDSDQAMLILNDIGWKNSNVYFHQKALKCFEPVADHFLAHPRYDSRDALTSISSCGELYLFRYMEKRAPEDLESAVRYLDAAMEYGQRMIEWAREHQDPHWYYVDFQTQTMIRVYARLYMATGQREEAQRALQLYCDAILKYKDHPDMAYESNMASWHRYNAAIKCEMGEYDEALRSLEVSYGSYEKYFAMKNPRIFEILELLVRCHLKKNQLAEARRYLEQAISLAEEMYVGDHPILMRLREMEKKCIGG